MKPISPAEAGSAQPLGQSNKAQQNGNSETTFLNKIDKSILVKIGQYLDPETVGRFAESSLQANIAMNAALPGGSLIEKCESLNPSIIARKADALIESYLSTKPDSSDIEKQVFRLFAKPEFVKFAQAQARLNISLSDPEGLSSGQLNQVIQDLSILEKPLPQINSHALMPFFQR